MTRLRGVWFALSGLAGMLLAIPAGLLPARYWRRLDRYVPVTRAALLSSIATFAAAFIVGVPAFFRHLEGHANRATDLMLQATSWRAPSPGALPPSTAVATASWYVSFLSPLSFLFTPLGLVAAYLAISGSVRALSVFVDDPKGDPLLTLVETIVRRGRARSAAAAAASQRRRLEGPEVADRLITGRAGGFPEADYVVVSSRRKPGWEAGVFVITSEAWFRLGPPEDRDTPGGLRTLYPMSELRVHEVLRRGVPYELPALTAPPGSGDDAPATRPAAASPARGRAS